MHMWITIAFFSALSTWNSNKNDDDNIYWDFPKQIYHMGSLPWSSFYR